LLDPVEGYSKLAKNIKFCRKTNKAVDGVKPFH
jgi:hypothetical protein